VSASVVLVTGATDGIGRETALELARRGARVVAHGRDAKKLAAVHASLRGLAADTPDTVRADFASLDEVRSMAGALAARREPLTVLLNNAGVYTRKPARSKDGFELTFAVNHLAHFLLTHLVLENDAGSLERIVNVSSGVHASGEIDLADPDGSKAGKTGYEAYAHSKLANVLFSVELARRLAPRRIDVNALHPGVVSTNLLRAGFGGGGPDSLEEGAATSVLLALAPEVRGVTGKYFARCRETRSASLAGDADLARRFYEVSCRLAGCRPI
jgi:NAD(P)-dependent dehydrogenase (short-subunit alcohol dehydrogenase family)